jgi:hypothetical protein
VDHEARPDTAELLAKLPPLPNIKRPFFKGPDELAQSIEDGGAEYLEEMISGRFLDFMLNELLTHLPDVSRNLEKLGPAGLILQARPSNTINALTVPTRDGVVIIYNLGFYSLLSSAAQAVALVVTQRTAGPQAVNWLSGVVDWATSRAKEPRIEILERDAERDDLAVNIAAQGQRFAMCHELGHVIAFDRTEEPTRAATVDGVAVGALQDTWTKEYAADRDGLEMFLRVLASRGKSVSGALIGAELFLNAAGMLQESSVDEGNAHPPPDERLARVRHQFDDRFGEKAPVLAGPAMTVRHVMEQMRGHVTLEVRRRRADARQQLDVAFEAYAVQVPGMTRDEKREAAKRISRLLLTSPGATLDFLHEKIFAPRGADEPDGGSPTRLLAVNAALHFEKSLQAALEIPRLRLGEPS